MEQLVNEYEQLVIQSRRWQETPEKSIHYNETLAFRSRVYETGEALKKAMKGPESEIVKRCQAQRFQDLTKEFNQNIMASWSKAKERLQAANII